MANHSVIVGGSTASRVINCPGSVALVAQMPPKPSSKYADEGSLLHEVIAEVIGTGKNPYEFIGRKFNKIELTSDLIDSKLIPAIELFGEVDENYQMEFEVESRVGFGDLLPGVFGSTDLIGRLGDTAIVLDWKFGDGVPVPAEENYQLMFYACAAMRTKETKWAFDGASEIELIIIQPPSIKRWKTTFKRLEQFEADLVRAVRRASDAEAPLKAGSHCRWCAAKPICPVITGAVDRVVSTKLANLPAQQIGAYLEKAEILEDWIRSLRELALEMLENDRPVPGWKLIAKRATRQWMDESAAKASLLAHLQESEVMETSLISPAKAEKALKKVGQSLPEDLVVAISSGSTLAPESDPRPAVLNVGKQLKQALSKLQ